MLTPEAAMAQRNSEYARVPDEASKICINGESIFLGLFKTKAEAARARAAAEDKYHGAFRYHGRESPSRSTNSPDE
jgi:hypothetical protein